MKATLEEFESPLPHKPKPVPVAGFGILNENFARSLPRIYHYRKPRIVKSQSGWYIEYWYRIPVDVKHLYKNKE